ncbi:MULTISPECIES: hypothetical protein [unclassified Ruegeria]|uniref:hypothetical protein n=1 Tax=unclassified Ruegeria TaxID=2625375 RepID=UPI001487A6E9|nr:MULTISPECIES: hypothetical protein [unclassified Ruegeria]
MFDASSYLAITSIAVIGTVHVFCVSFYRRFPALAGWLSDFSSGIGLGYAFLFLLPKIGELSADLAANGKWENSLFGYSLLGFLIYYLLEASRDTGADNRLSLGLDTVALGTYNCLLAITVMQTTGTSPELYAFGTLAYSLHLFGVNIFLYKTHPGHMSGWLRAYFVVSLAVGILIGLNADKSSMIYSIATGLTGGVIIALSLRVKLPSLSAVNTKALLIGVVFAAVAVEVTRY